MRYKGKYGICSKTAECRRLLAQERRDALPKPERPTCKNCGRTLRADTRSEYCTSNERPECRNAARRAARNGKAAQWFRPVINPGDRFGRWIALEGCTPGNKRIPCRCDCGNERPVLSKELAKGASQSCGCARNGPRLGRDPYLTAGSVFSRLTVLEDAAYNRDLVPCRCECGNEKKIAASSVRLGLTRSCGCLSLERQATQGGLSKHPLYPVWNSMIDRCTDPKVKGYHNYGGRGIKVCDRWFDLRLFIEDVEREIGPRPEGVQKSGRVLYSFDREDNDGNYEPGNVCWSTSAEQVRNQRKVAKMTLDMAAITKERDALAAELAALKASLATA
jgi:hypothetical protein